MKRSEINRLMKEAEEFLTDLKFMLPPFAFWSPEDWAEKGHEYDEIRDNMLGWDITDFGFGSFRETGLLLFTIRNGNLEDTEKYVKPYAEKILIADEEQVTPFHFHWSKMEDIINRGGGNLMVQVYNSTTDERFADTPVTLHVDGREFRVKAGEIIRLAPGESISIQRGLYHKFWGEKGTGKVLLGEVSKVNDDRVDNRFYEPTGRFPAIEEDAPALHLLCNEYPSIDR